MLSRIYRSARTQASTRRKPSSITNTASSRTTIRQNHAPTSRGQPQPEIPSSSRVQRYLPRLHDLSKRTGVPLSSLAISFLILHELTAVLPVIGFYFLFSSLGTGLGIINWLDRTTGTEGEQETTGWKGVVKGWHDEAQEKMGRVGKRYGLWQNETEGSLGALTKGRAGEGVANAISAYVVVKVGRLQPAPCRHADSRKALLPVRIGVSLGAAPVFARWALEPIRNVGKRLLRRGGP